jgi:CO/xanthine dehydrogenase Mo-binding subunit
VGTDPVAFHLRYLTTLCGIAVVKAVAERAGWQPRPSHNPDCSGDTLRDRGIAYAQRSGAVVAIVAGVEIDRRTGKVWARKFTVAHDCGLIINPDGGCENFRSKLFRQCEPVHRPAGWEAR